MCPVRTPIDWPEMASQIRDALSGYPRSITTVWSSGGGCSKGSSNCAASTGGLAAPDTMSSDLLSNHLRWLVEALEVDRSLRVPVDRRTRRERAASRIVRIVCAVRRRDKEGDTPRLHATYSASWSPFSSAIGERTQLGGPAGSTTRLRVISVIISCSWMLPTSASVKTSVMS